MWVFLKVFGDLCLCFGIMGMLPSLFVHGFSLLWPAVLCAFGGAAAAYLVNQGKGNWRFLALILPLATWMLPETTIEYLMLAPSFAYSAVVIIRGDLTLEYYSYRISFQRCCKILVGLYLVAALFGQVELMASKHYAVMESSALLGYGVLYLISGCLLLRELRMGMDYGASERAMGNLQMALVLGGSGAVLVGLLHARDQLQAWGLQLLRWLWSGVIIVIAALGWLIEQLFGDGLKEFSEELESAEATTRVTAEMPPMSGTGEYTEPVAEIGYPWWLAVLIALAILAMLLILLRSFRSQISAPASEETVRESVEADKESKSPRGSNRYKVRRYYRDFLRYQRKKGVALRTNQTSQDILDTVNQNEEAASQLRQIYIAARYDETREVTAEQVRQAKSALKRTKE